MIINKHDYSIEYKNVSFHSQFVNIPLDNILDTKIFETYKTEETRLFSIKDAINCDLSQLNNLVFIYAPEYEEADKYFTIKLNLLNGENEN